MTVPVAVYNEIASLGSIKRGHDIVDIHEFLHVKEVKNHLAVNLLRAHLDYGEAEAIVLAKELGALAML